jgi:hypothetical protein
LQLCFDSQNIIFTSNSAPGLQAAEKDLKNQQTSVALSNALKNRPQIDQLVKEGILKSALLPPCIRAGERLDLIDDVIQVMKMNLQFYRDGLGFQFLSENEYYDEWTTIARCSKST